MKNNRYELCVKKNIPHTYLWYALKFSILIYPLHYNWYYSHFIDPVIYGYKGQNKYKIVKAGYLCSSKHY